MAEHNYHHGDLKNALIRAGVEILSKDGLSGLSLRKVARKAGVSHSAPYAHYADKQALIAAISTEGFHRLYLQLNQATQLFANDPRQQIIACGRAYIQFALDEKDIFKIMFSGILEKEKDYPDFVEISQMTFEFLVGVVNSCQAAGVLRPAVPDLMAVTIWAQVHGLVSLALEGQISHTVLDVYQLDGILLFALGAICSCGFIILNNKKNDPLA